MKTYASGEQVLAAELTQIAKVAGLYAASSAGTDTYAITVTPTPTSYATGDVFRFLADVGNTGTCTLNVNGLGAKTIKKIVGAKLDLATGDIIAGQVCEVVYDGTDLILVNQPRSLVSKGQATRSTTGVQTIAHGLGTIPKLVVFRFLQIGIGNSKGHTVVNASAKSTSDREFTYMRYYDNATETCGQSTSGVFASANQLGSAGFSADITTLDATNIELTWSTGGAGGGAVNFQWEAFA